MRWGEERERLRGIEIERGDKLEGRVAEKLEFQRKHILCGRGNNNYSERINRMLSNSFCKLILFLIWT